MMSLDVLRRVNEEIAAEAAQRGLVPFVPDSTQDVDHWPPFPLPNLGYLEPEGWEKAELIGSSIKPDTVTSPNQH